ncbi:MAG: NAD(P)-dependent alcohol dehydrogenase [Saccharofermentanales bacterium]
MEIINTDKKNRRLLLDSSHKFTMVDETIPIPGENEVLVKIAANGICGSDIHFFKEGRLGNFVVTTPYTPGHESCGTITALGPNAKGFEIGDRVVIEPGIPCGLCDHCKSGRYNLCGNVVFLSAPPINGTFCDYIAIRSDMVYKMPDEMTFEQGALVEPAAVAVHAVNRAGFINGASGVILGAGPIGLLVLQAFKAAGGGKAICIDLLDNRLEIAKKLGADVVINPKNNGMDAENIGDVVFETAGSSKTTAMLYKLARPGGIAVQVGWPEKPEVGMNIADFLDKELTYIGVNRYANAFKTAISQISDGRIRTDLLMTQKFDFDHVEQAFRFAAENPRETIKVVVIN